MDETLPSSADAAAIEAVAARDLANALRALSMDAVERAKSGHPGMPMGMADVATVLFRDFLKFDPSHPEWPDRDRFVLSAGHGSMLLYALLHLTGYADFPLEELKRFRQWGSKCAGHPEFGHGAGVETTTGPLGQGIATAVGMAIAERILAARFGDALVNHRTYVIASDGDLMEGISHEAISLAGHLGLSKLIVLFDDNGISIDGPVSLSETGDQLARFEAAGWSVSRVDGHDQEAIKAALSDALDAVRPSLIACRTVIGYGAPTKQGTEKTHGSPLGAEEVAAARVALNWPHAAFEVPAPIRGAWAAIGAKGKAEYDAWTQRRGEAPETVRKTFDHAINGDLRPTLIPALAAFRMAQGDNQPAVATRKASEMVLEIINANIEEMVGGSADLTGSNNTRTKGMAALEAGDFSGRFIHYGVREHGMAAAMNGMALHGGVIPYSGTFLVFSDYCRPSIRLAALMGIRVIHVLTHDSIGLGEDGPTHQPVEHLAALRAIPNLHVLRPCDVVETAECWELALNRKNGPSVLALTRQNLPLLRTDRAPANRSAKGAYILRAAGAGKAKVTLIGTGSEVAIAVAARSLLEAEGIPANVVSMPCMELFLALSEAEQDAIIDPATVCVAVEAAIALGWDRIIGRRGAFVGMKGFGASAPYQDLYHQFGITAEAVAMAAKQRLSLSA
ncbi:MAG: transketolase [Alphaproteobacteria bacterium]|nr:transketolase [Alphaproteobacteria bacterium]